MQFMGLNEIREKYLSFFEGKEHLRMQSFPLVPREDKSLLLINSGMAPLKPYFTGRVTPPSKRVTTCQKCIRTPDIERVGKTSRHGTFFEMLGNFSFGDYFKEDATKWAWEFCTEVMGLPVDKLYVSYYHEDLEAFDIWRDKRGVDPSHIVPLGKEDNFWEIGTGPCGPCSEIYFDRGEENGCGKEGCAVGCDCDRFVEFWNLVFTQFDSDGKGNYTPLAKPNIDTGMGLERLACIMQGVSNLFEVDTIKKVLLQASEYAGITYGQDEKKDVSLRVITDHIRSTTFLISDGVLPGNEGRGYVLRRLIRRAARHGKLLGINRKFLSELCLVVINESGSAYPELVEKSDYIKKVIEVEEDRFNTTIDQGLSILKAHIDELLKKGEKSLSGENVFKLYDTFGFPLDLTSEILEEHGLGVSIEEFEAEMKLQKERARAARKAKGDLGWSESVIDNLDKSFKTEFVGYETLVCKASVFAIVSENELAERAESGKQVVIITDKSPFYAESGGQVGDIGLITADGMAAEVFDTKKTADGKYLHFAIIEEGEIAKGDQVIMTVDAESRAAIMRNHSSAHLLQAALKSVLGSHVEQSGSYVDSEKMRFDFSHFSPMTAEEIAMAEHAVNRAVLSGAEVEISEMPIAKAREIGATALFGEKYGETVRVVNMKGCSVELCGGTHVENTSKIGLFKILGESSVAAGIRRIEATTGMNIIKLIDEKQNVLSNIAGTIKSGLSDLPEKAKGLIETVKSMQKEINELKSKIAGSQLDELLDKIVEINGVKVITVLLPNAQTDTLREIGDRIRDRGTEFVAVLGGKSNIIAVCGKEAVAKGLDAGKIVKEAAKLANGGGGGRADSAMAGCKDESKIDDAIKFAFNMIKEDLEK